MQISERGEHFFAVLAGIDVQEDLLHHSIGIDQEGVAGGELYYVEIHHRAVLFGDFVVGVGEEFKVQAFFGAELLVGIGGVYTDADE